MSAHAVIHTARALARSRSGNFGMMAAVILPVLFGAGGVAIDMTRMMVVKNNLQEATDAAALAASTALMRDGVTEAQAKAIAVGFLKAHLKSTGSVAEGDSTKDPEDDYDLASSSDIKIEQIATVGNGKRFVVGVNSTKPYYFNALTRFLGKDKIDLGAYSKAEAATEAKNALSMHFVLDRSGSMGEDTSTVDKDNPTKVKYYECGTKWKSKTCSEIVTNYVIKITALKLAVAELLTQFVAADPKSQLVRTGAVSYNYEMQTPLDIDWGTTGTMNYVNNLTAYEGTDSGAAFKTAYQRVMASSENTEHKKRNGQVPTKYIVFMTDGDNNYAAADTETKLWCDKARADKIEVYTVAFMAPDRGKALLDYCATSKTHSFKAENSAELTAAFKYIGEKATEMTSRLTK